jgi:inorganic pyrophosphatase/exopolyphosphatase
MPSHEIKSDEKVDPTWQPPAPLDDDEEEIPGITFVRQKSLAEQALSEHRPAMQRQISELKAVESEETIRGLTDLPDFKDVGFVGHTATDMDSIGSALGAAELFGGIAARASDINTETAWALDHWGIPVPEPFLDVAGERKVCIVDHNQASQMTAGVELDRLVGCIDHHAMQSGTVVTDLPIYVNIQPGGSACSFIASKFVRNRKQINKKTAGILLSGILSDTLNLHSPTTTPQDRMMLAILAELAEVTDLNGLAGSMFREKSKNRLLFSCHGILLGDLKYFTLLTWKIAFGTCETVLSDDVLAKKDELLIEMKALKKEKQLDCVFFSVVDILAQTSKLLICGETEAFVAQEAFGAETKNGLADLGARVSRKKQFIPPLSNLMSGSFTVPEAAIAADQKELQEANFGVIVHECNTHGCVTERKISSIATFASVSMARNGFKKLAHKHTDACDH